MMTQCQLFAAVTILPKRPGIGFPSYLLPLSSFPLLFLELLPKINLKVQLLGEPRNTEIKERADYKR